MATTFQTSKKLKQLTKGFLWILPLFLLLLLFFFSSNTPKIEAAFISSWWSDSWTSYTPEQRTTLLSKFDSTFVSHVESGNDFIIVQSTALGCRGFVIDTTGNALIINDNSGSNIGITESGSGNIYHHGFTGNPTCSTVLSTSPTRSSPSTGTNLGAISFELIAAAKIGSINYPNGTTPAISASEINSTLNLTPPFVPDPLWYNSALELAPLEVKVPQANALSPSNRCYPSKQIPMSDWYKKFEDYALSSTNTDDLDAFNRLKDVMTNGGGGWIMAQDSDDELSTMVLYIYTGSPTVTWESPTPTHPNGRVYIPTTGLTKRTTVKFEIFCNNFGTQGHLVLLNSVLNYNGSFRLDKNAITNVSGGLWSPITRELHRRSIFASGNIDLNYPTGYTGLTIPSSAFEATKINAKTYTDFDVFMDGYQITATYKGSEYDDPKCTFIHWRVVRVDDREDVYELDRVQSHYTTMGNSLELIADDTGFFRIDAIWSWASTSQEFTNSGLNPANQAYCQQKVLAGTGEIALALAQGRIPANSGKAFPLDGFAKEVYGYSASRECTIDNQSYFETGFYPPTMLCVYTTSWTLEDCAVYGIDELHLRIGCELNNFAKTLRSALIQFLIPSPGSIQATFNNLLDDLNKNVSILTYPLYFTVDTMTQISQQSPNCTVSVSNIFSSGTSINLCYLKTAWSDYWNLAVLTFRITIVLTFIFMSYKLLTRIFTTGGE